MGSKDRKGNFFDDFRLGQVMRHSTPRTVTDGDCALYIALTGSRHATHSSLPIAQALGFASRPLDDLLLFNIAFGKTVPDISLNAVANLGYAEMRFLQPVYSGDTIRSESKVIGLKENSSGKTGVVYVRSTSYNEQGQAVLTWVRWVMVHKSPGAPKAPEQLVPVLAAVVQPDQLLAHAKIPGRSVLEDFCDATGSGDLWDDYSAGERINHPLGMTIEEADHMTATRLYQNNSRPHFDALEMRHSKIGRRLVYGGHVISTCRALAYDGLENVVSVLAFNGGTHSAPTVAGDTLYAYTEVIDKWRLHGRADVGALRLRLVGLKNVRPEAVASSEKGAAHPAVVLDLDYTVLMPRRQNGARHDA